jgi:hypothetical protein
MISDRREAKTSKKDAKSHERKTVSIFHCAELVVLPRRAVCDSSAERSDW